MKRIQKLICAVLLLAAIAGSSYAQSQWDGEMPMYDASARYSGGSGTEDDPFLIGSAADFAQFSANVKMENEAVTGKYFLLTTDLDMGGAYDSTTKRWGGKRWKPIGYYESDLSGKFNGTFDGGGHSISNLYVRFSGYYATTYYHINQGLFSSIGPEGTVKNLRIVSGYIEGHEYTGAIAGYNRGKIIACVNEGMRIDGDSTDIRGLAGITGFNYGTVAGCYSTGSIVTGRGADRVAGITFGESPDGCYYKASGTTPAGGSVQGFRVDDISELNSSKILATLNTIIGLDNRVHYKAGDPAYKNPPAFTTERPATQPVSGKVTAEPDGYPIENARITLKLSGNTIATTVTDKEGNYTLDVIPGELYVLTADRGGYSGQRLFSFTVTDSPVTGKDFCLTIIPEYAWYTANPSAERFTITSSAELRTFAAIVNGTFYGLHDTFEGKSIALNADIDLSEEFSPNLLLGSGKKWEPIGKANEDSCFNGIFDGNGHSIKYIYIDPDSNYELFSAARTTSELTDRSESTIPVSARSYQGLFGTIGTKGTVKNLHIASDYLKGKEYTGCIAGYNKGNIVACSGSAEVRGYEQTGKVGGIAGYNEGTITACLYNGILDCSHSATGGITVNGTVQAGFYVAASDIGSGTLPRGTRVNDVAELNKASLLDYLNDNIAGWNREHPDIATPFRFTAGADPETDLPYLAFPTGVCETAEEPDITVYSSNGTIVIEGIAPGAPYSITGFTGIAFDNGTAADNRITVSAPQGFYIVKTGTKAKKVEVR